ncbi:hypothetical protein K438DRAFT_1763020 [Mycena galopus ATCC 62051]|nr:hypothetical protein K438DRAFT_1763020 [Mycena galopus ATCC 62051]
MTSAACAPDEIWQGREGRDTEDRDERRRRQDDEGRTVYLVRRTSTILGLVKHRSPRDKLTLRARRICDQMAYSVAVPSSAQSHTVPGSRGAASALTRGGVVTVGVRNPRSPDGMRVRIHIIRRDTAPRALTACGRPSFKSGMNGRIGRCSFARACADPPRSSPRERYVVRALRTPYPARPFKHTPSGDMEATRGALSNLSRSGAFDFGSLSRPGMHPLRSAACFYRSPLTCFCSLAPLRVSTHRQRVNISVISSPYNRLFRLISVPVLKIVDRLPHRPRQSSTVLLSVDEIDVSLLHCENVVRVVRGDVRIHSFHCATASASPSATRSMVASLCCLDFFDKDGPFPIPVSAGAPCFPSGLSTFVSCYFRLRRSCCVTSPAAPILMLAGHTPYHILRVIAVDSGILPENIFLISMYLITLGD